MVDVRNVSALAYHLYALVLNLYYLNGMYNLVEEYKEAQQYYRQLLYFTNQAHIIVCLYYIYVVLVEIWSLIRGKEYSQRYGSFVQYLFRTAISFTFLTAVMFWTIWMINPEMLFKVPQTNPDYQESFFEKHRNVMVYTHLINHVLLYLETVIIPNDQVKLKNMLIFEGVYGLVYKILTFWYTYQYQKSIYPFEKNTSLAIDIYAGTAVLAVLYQKYFQFYFVDEKKRKKLTIQN